MDSPDPVIPPVLQLDESGRLTHELPCVQCGYNLRGLDPRGGCPECGTPVTRSVRGDMLCFSNPAWLRRLALGADLLFVALLLHVLLPFASCCVLSSITHIPGSLMLLAPLAVHLTGAWQFTAPDPGRTSQTLELSNAAIVARVAAFAALAVAVVPPLVMLLQISDWTSSLLYLLSVGALGVSLAALLRHAKSLARRLPDEPLMRTTAAVSQGIGISLAICSGASFLLFSLLASEVLTAIGTIMLGLVLLLYIFAILTLFLLNRYRRALHAAHRQSFQALH